MPEARITGVMQASSGEGARSFATKAAGFECVFRVMDVDKDGYKYAREEWVIPFNGSRSSQFGVFTTTDKRVHEFFDERKRKQLEAHEVPDVMELAEFMQMITPPEVKIKHMAEELKALREKNSMLEQVVHGGSVPGLGQADKPANQPKR
jgi:hypothetical protein